MSDLQTSDPPRAPRATPREANAKSGSTGYTVLARRYRSRDFDELIGQEPIARTLKNAIASNRIAHAYLFCGTRGVGKTSMARIFAKAMNADPGLSESALIAEAILRGDDLDVIEIDGASNRGIQEARDLIAGAGLSPARCPYKIYIIDEVHMLTKEAFNALLKTMEEPPAHVKFILCTTDPQKVPATIQSRCQRFDFRAISTAQITEHLHAILREEGVEAEDALIAQVARLGQGSMRDALSLLDRLLAGGETSLTVQHAEQMLGLPDHTLVNVLVQAIIDADPKSGLEAGAELLARGSTVEQALELLAEHLRQLLVCRACGSDASLLEVSSEAMEALAKQAEHFDLAALVHMIALCDAAARNARNSAAARAIFDAAIVRLCLSEHFSEIATLLDASGGSGGGSGGNTGAAAKPRKKKGRVTSPATPGSDPGSAPGSSPGSSGPGSPGSVVPSSSPTPAVKATAPSVHGERVVEVKAGPGGGVPADDDGRATWRRVLEAAAAAPGDAARVQHLIFESFDGRTLRLAIDEAGAKTARFISSQSDAVAKLVERAIGARVKVVIDAAAAMATPTARVTAELEAHLEEVRRLPIVQKATELFDAVIMDVRDVPPDTPHTPTTPTPDTPPAEEERN